MEVETAEHVFRDCVWTRGVWDLCPINVHVDDSPLECWVRGMFGKLEDETLCLSVTVLWTLWFASNVFVFQGKRLLAREVVDSATAHRRDYLAAHPAIAAKPRGVRQVTVWSPPRQGQLKLNIDASVRPSLGTGIAGVLRDEGGRVRWCYGELSDSVVVDVAEALAIRRGMEFARDNGVRDLLVESDAQIVIYVLLYPRQDLSYVGTIVRDIRDLVADFDRVTFAWIRRAGNYVAHLLVFYAFTSATAFFSIHVSDHIVATVEAEFPAVY